MAIGEARIASPERVASQGEATILALPFKESLALICKAFSSSEFKIIALLAPSGALSFDSRLRSLAFNALVLALQIRTLALGVVSENDPESVTLLAHRGALVLASRATSLAPVSYTHLTLPTIYSV